MQLTTLILALAAIAVSPISGAAISYRDGGRGGRGAGRGGGNDNDTPPVNNSPPITNGTTPIPNPTPDTPAAPGPAPGVGVGIGGSTGINLAVIPDSFGIVAGNRNPQNPSDCIGINNAPIPCTCPPTKDDAKFTDQLFRALSQGFFPDQSIVAPLTLDEFNDASDTSERTNRNRATAMVQVLQSLSGKKGVGCPGVSYPVLVQQQKTGVVV